MALGPRFLAMGGYARGQIDLGTGPIQAAASPENSDIFVFAVGK